VYSLLYTAAWSRCLCERQTRKCSVVFFPHSPLKCK